MNQTALIAERKEPRVIEFSVAGAPIPQGSKVGLISGKRVRKGKDVWVKNPIISMVDQSDRKTDAQPANRLKKWKASIERKADVEIRGDLIGPVFLWRGPIIVECEFVFPRSVSHYRKRKSGITNLLTKSAPMVPQNDLDKLLRAVDDALSKVVYWDDVQVVGFGASTKRFAKTRDSIGGVYVKVREL